MNWLAVAYWLGGGLSVLIAMVLWSHRPDVVDFGVVIAVALLLGRLAK